MIAGASKKHLVGLDFYRTVARSLQRTQVLRFFYVTKSHQMALAARAYMNRGKSEKDLVSLDGVAQGGPRRKQP